MVYKQHLERNEKERKRIEETKTRGIDRGCKFKFVFYCRPTYQHK
jgi:hypothetical protein